MNYLSFLPFSNIVSNFVYVQNDFISLSLNPFGIFGVMVNIIFATVLISTLYLLGIKIKNIFFKRDNEGIEHFINIAIGYVVFTSGIAILGMASLFYNYVLYLYIFTCFLFAFYPLSETRKYGKEIKDLLWNELATQLRRNRGITVAALLFIAIAFLRLIPPEIGEDAIGYHTSLPYLYLQEHSIMKNPQYALNIVFPIPQLGEMLYVATQALGIKDASRYVHFFFYLAVVLLIYWEGKKSKYSSFYGALLFITAPVVIQVSSRANMDFPWLLCWLLAVLLITNNIRTPTLILAGILFGGVLATKLWTIVFLPLFIFYLFLTVKNYYRATGSSLIFVLSAILVSAMWYIRAYVVSGNPLYPAFSQKAVSSELFDYIGFNNSLFHYENIVAFSPLFYISLALFIMEVIRSRKIQLKNLLVFLLLLCFAYLVVKYHFPRYVLGLYIIAVLYIAYRAESFFKKSTFYKYTFVLLYVVLFIYYFINTLFILPYGFGWADKNKYLTRILSRDNSSYYDFDGLFGKHISANDVVATYGIYGYYYADFNYVDVSKIITTPLNKSLNEFRKKNITKLLIKGGDINWFCAHVGLEDCGEHDIELIATYPLDSKKYNLYDLK